MTTAALTLPCRREGTTVAVDWYRPPGDPTGLVWLQHGFSRRKRHVASLAAAVAASTGAVVVAPSIGSGFWSRSGCWINGDAMHRAIADLLAGRFEWLQASATSAGLESLPSSFVLAGHSAGGNLATAVAGHLAEAPPDRGPGFGGLRGVVLFDGVDHGGAMGAALDRLSGERFRPVWTIAAPDSSCNAKSSGTKALQQGRPGQFVGVRLTTGSHVDAEGPDGGHMASVVCGAARAENVAAVRTLAASWIGALLAGHPGDALFADPADSPDLGTPVVRL
jgi:hypothetical protein